jgi:CRP/FNR family transcriptional regulator
MNKPLPRSTDVLCGLPPELFNGLFAGGRPVALAADQTLFVAGEVGNGCYRVEEGLLKASIGSPTGAERILAILGPGNVVGELSMISGLPRSASVAAVRDSKLRFVSQASFDGYARENPAIYRHLDAFACPPPARHERRARGDDFPALARSRCGLAFEPGRGFRPRCRKRTHPDPAENHTGRSCRDGGSRPRECQPHTEGMRRSLVTRLAGYYCLENKAALEREAEVS